MALSSEDEQSGEARTCVVEENEGRRKEKKSWSQRKESLYRGLVTEKSTGYTLIIPQRCKISG